MQIYPIVKREMKFFIGVPLKTSNKTCSKEMPLHWATFQKEKIASKIPNRVDSAILALYTQYEKDQTQPYTYILGCEVSSLDEIPEGLVGIVIPKSKYAVFTTEGIYPYSLKRTWETVLKSGFKRSFTFDYEYYDGNFHPKYEPQVKIFIAIDG